ncbi:type II toxin-antitoxin system death-on-curing family toxin [Pelodictyon phaeoclathratiforme]|jgi:death-on-curing protein|uniref:Death-on-curing family protein n=1 Tax=Pelodictyon phaeoclathratiforme (strain DSM 5477 / BU-1) TaxID=324925 RepID=B4S9T7_PELPB|nr:type II toxin-antitoxin system death-on-curing family toxin [Pelodictyon phaeoclathratiforme]ACF43633.1 death-on-curing family protein [Pelodictyon phaeoclathratiforme BU-1]MBV5289069.1 type II toxin-antitoxin system death-on-curing family toxin [Pelodictyon phaeoclathratiforme]
MTWRWLLDGVVIAIHDEQIAEHGGSPGIRDVGLLSSALARPQNQANYGEPSLFDLAAAYAYGIIRNHPFIDGNKRTGFLAAYVFLNINGWELMLSEAEAINAVLALAAGEMDEPRFSNWLKNKSVIRAEQE